MSKEVEVKDKVSALFMLSIGYSWKYIYKQGDWECTFLFWKSHLEFLDLSL